MLAPDLFSLFVRPLEEHDLAYMVTGSVASMVYGEPRLNHGIDVILRLKLKDANRLQNIFPLTEFYVPPVESLRLEIRRDARGHFNLIHHQTGFKADIYLEGMDPMHRWAMENRRQYDFFGAQDLGRPARVCHHPEVGVSRRRWQLETPERYRRHDPNGNITSIGSS